MGQGKKEAVTVMGRQGERRGWGGMNPRKRNVKKREKKRTVRQTIKHYPLVLLPRGNCASVSICESHSSRLINRK